MFDPIQILVVKQDDGTLRMHLSQGRDFRNALDTILEKLDTWTRVQAPLERILKLRQGVISQVRADWKRLSHDEFKAKYHVSVKGMSKIKMDRFRKEFPGSRLEPGQKRRPDEGKSSGRRNGKSPMAGITSYPR